jgi:hypothetical protein
MVCVFHGRTIAVVSIKKALNKIGRMYSLGEMNFIQGMLNTEIHHFSMFLSKKSNFLLRVLLCCEFFLNLKELFLFFREIFQNFTTFLENFQPKFLQLHICRILPDTQLKPSLIIVLRGLSIKTNKYELIDTEI